MNSFRIGKKTVSNLPRPHVQKWVYDFLRKLGGKTDYGDDFLKLAWGMEEKVIAFGEQRMKYLAASATVRTGWRIDIASAMTVPIMERVDIGRHRWFVEEWWPPELLKKDYDEFELGPFPQRGSWKCFMVLETEDGQYRAPDRECMNWVAELWQKRQAERQLFERNEQESDYWKRQKASIAEDDVQDYIEHREAAMKDRFKSLLAPHIKRMIHNNPNKGKFAHTRRKAVVSE